jgi:phage FluMu protein Com
MEKNMEEEMLKLATRVCTRMHCKMTEHACEMYQLRFDPESRASYRDGSCTSKNVHPCKGCEYHTSHSARKKSIKPKREPTKIHVESTTREKKPLRLKRTFRCWRCGTEDQDAFSEKKKSKFSSGGYKFVRSITCRKCDVEIVFARQSQKIEVKCPKCGTKRVISRGMASKTSFTGLCRSCGCRSKKPKIEKKKQKPATDYSKLAEYAASGMSVEDMAEKIGIGIKAIYKHLKIQKIEAPRNMRSRIKTMWVCKNCGPLPINNFYSKNRTLCKRCLSDGEREK